MQNKDYTELLNSFTMQININFPSNEELTNFLFSQINEFICTDFDGIPENKVFRLFLNTIKEMIEFSFKNNASKSYLRNTFKAINNKLLIEIFTNIMPKRINDVKFILSRLINFFVYQDVTSSNEYRLNEIIDFIESYE